MRGCACMYGCLWPCVYGRVCMAVYLCMTMYVCMAMYVCAQWLTWAEN